MTLRAAPEAPPVELPPTEAEGPPSAALAKWTIHDCHGVTLGSPLSTRTEALRTIGILTFHGAGLPLSVYGPDGQATGDRLG